MVRHPSMHAAIERVADNRVPDGIEMDPYLVRPTGVDRDAQERSTGDMARPCDARDGCPRTAGARRDLLAVDRIASDRHVDDALALLHEAPDKRHVLLFDFAIVKLARQLLMRGVVFGHNQ